MIMKELRVLIFSAAFGAGHVRAAEAIIDAIRLQVPAAEITHVDCGECLGKTFNMLMKNLYIGMIKHSPALWGGIYNGMAKITPDSVLQRLLNKMGWSEYKKIIHLSRPDFIICTYPTVAGVLSQMRLEHQLHVPVITVVTDYVVHNQWIHWGVDMYIVGSQQVREGFVAKGVRPERLKTAGIPVGLCFERPTDRIDAAVGLGLQPNRPTLLIMGGAYGVLDSLREQVRIFANTPYPLQIIVVCGKDDKLYKSLDDIVVTAANPIMRFGYVTNVEELMTVADLMITKAGGITVSEALTKRLPLVIFKPIPGQEEANANFLSRIGAGRVAYSQEDLAGIVQSLLTHPGELAQMRQAAAAAVPGSAAERAVESMLNLIGKAQEKKIG